MYFLVKKIWIFQKLYISIMRRMTLEVTFRDAYPMATTYFTPLRERTRDARESPCQRTSAFGLILSAFGLERFANGRI